MTNATTETIRVANAPCSWGVEFGNDPRNPPWERVLYECMAAGYGGIELGPLGYAPEDPEAVRDAFAARGLAMPAGVVFRPFHDPSKRHEVMDAARRTATLLAANGAPHIVLIDSIAEARAPTAGRPEEAVRMDDAEWRRFAGLFRDVARMGREEFGLDVSIHPHAAGFLDFEEETERLLEEVEELSLCPDTGHLSYAGFDVVPFLRRHMERTTYVHFKDIDPIVKARAIEGRIGFYEACAMGIFCNLGDGDVDFQAVRALLLERGYGGWCTVEQDCDPEGPGSPVDDARANREYLASIGFSASVSSPRPARPATRSRGGSRSATRGEGQP